MTGLKAKATAAFEEEVENRKVAAIAHFKKDFGVNPDKTSYLGDWRFRFKVNGLYVGGWIEYVGDYLYGKAYHLIIPCPRCEGFMTDEKYFFDLAGLGEAINRPQSGMCKLCSRLAS